MTDECIQIMGGMGFMKVSSQPAHENAANVPGFSVMSNQKKENCLFGLFGDSKAVIAFEFDYDMFCVYQI